MRVQQLRVRNYKSIDDSGWVDVDELTCLVGRNESGKTGFLQAVERINPSFGGDGYDVYTEYPREEWTAYRERHEDDPDVVASARLELEADERERVEREFGTGVLESPTVVASRDYADRLRWELDLDESAYVSGLLEETELPAELAAEYRGADSFDELRERLEGVDDPAAAELRETVAGLSPSTAAAEIGDRLLADWLPTFQYVGEYTVLDGRIPLEELLDRRDSGELRSGDGVFLSLLSIAGVDPERLREEDERRSAVAELESASRTVSTAAMRYWSQNENLRLRLRLEREGEEDVLEVRVEDTEHDVTVEFDGRSHGFRWFVSTFCTLYDAAGREDGPVLLLDEPGANLHARAKHDYLRFLREEVAATRPVVYTTHSPHMIEPDRLHQVKIVRAEPPEGPNVTDDVGLADPDSRFLLKNVVEMGTIDALLARPQTLLVGEHADHAYLHNVSELFRALGKDALDPRWTIVPVGSERNVPWFVSLIDTVELDVAALLSDRRAVDGWIDDATIPAENVKTVSEFTAANADGTVEDLFSTECYLEIVNRAYATEIAAADGVGEALEPADLGARGGVVERLSEAFDRHGIGDGRFDREVPARYFQRNREEFVDDLDDPTRNAFSTVFRTYNRTLGSFEGVSEQRKTLWEILNIG